MHELGYVKRDEHNPILSPLDFDWANRKIYNAAVIRDPLDLSRLLMIFRAVGEDWISRFGYAFSYDYSNFRAEKEPIFIPEKPYESKGVEDPRITLLADKFRMTYVAYNGRSARIALAESVDLHTWKRIGPLLPKWSLGFWQKISKGEKNWSKAGVIFPKKTSGKYLMLFGDDNIWPAWSEDLIEWDPSEKAVLTSREEGFDAGYVEMGPPPIKTDNGWLIFYHGVQQYRDRSGDPRVYRLGAALMDLKDPTKILWRSENPLLEPKDNELSGITDALDFEGGYEDVRNIKNEEVQKKIASGDVPLAIFCCGAVREKDTIHLYYSSMDTTINHATIKLEDIFKH